MSHVQAYVCDYKNHLVPEDGACGIIVKPDMFRDTGEDYETTSNPKKCKVHFCTDCYREQVLIPASNLVNRKKEGEEVYKNKVIELTFGFCQSTVKKWRSAQK